MKKFQYDFINRVRKHDFLTCCFDEIATFIACQFALESNFGRSRLAVECNNYSGMKSINHRVGFDIYPGSKFAEYDDLDFCLLDYIVWLAYNKCSIYVCQDLDKFKKFLVDKKYCPEPDYIDKISSIYSQFKSYKNEK